MRIKIHRGTKQIGGCITEITTDNARIFIDMGAELPNDDKLVKPAEKLQIEGVTTGSVDCDAILFTHYHGDHIGHYSEVLPEIPLYMGETAKEIFYALCKRIDKDNTHIVKRINTFKVGKPLLFKDIKVTPFMVDHSAYDAYMFLIEADGKKILHTGDFRGHGPRGKGLIPTLEKYVGQVDVLITEGTMLSRGNERIIKERDLETKARKIITENKYVFIICSSTNIDRIAAFHNATPKGKYFICDSYQKEVLDIVKKNGAKYSSMYAFNKTLIYGENLIDKLSEKGFCMLVRNNMAFKEIMKKFDTSNSIVVYSVWKGYLTRNSGLLEFIKGYKCKYLHTSGHATIDTIISVCNTVKPKKAIIPIHSESPMELGKYGLNYNIEYLKDGQVFYV